MAISTVSQKGLDAPLTLTSPVLTTPNLGTPSAINLSNATALPSSALPTGSVLQVVNATYSTYSTLTTSTYTDTGLTATITPKFSTSKILVLTSMNGTGSYASGNAALGLRLLRSGSVIFNIDNSAGYSPGVGASERDIGSSGVCSYLDSPATTSATIYKIQYANLLAAGTVFINNYVVSANLSGCSITLMEIAG